MLKPWKAKDMTQSAEFCDRCSSVCDGNCRANELLQVSRDRVARLGVRRPR